MYAQERSLRALVFSFRLKWIQVHIAVIRVFFVGRVAGQARAWQMVRWQAVKGNAV